MPVYIVNGKIKQLHLCAKQGDVGTRLDVLHALHHAEGSQYLITATAQTRIGDCEEVACSALRQSDVQRARLRFPIEAHRVAHLYLLHRKA